MNARLLLASLLLASIDTCDSPRTPAPSTTSTTTTTTVQADLPRADVTPNLSDYASFTFFAAAVPLERDFFQETAGEHEARIMAQCAYAIERGWPFMRVGAETVDWLGRPGYLRPGPAPLLEDGTFNPEWERNLRRVLRATARVPGCFVQLSAVFTIKESRPFSYQRRVAERVADIVREGEDGMAYEHVILEAYNEYWVHAPNVGEAEVDRILRILASRGFFIGSDARGEGDYGPDWDPIYPADLLPLVNYVSFHPPRNPAPDRSAFRLAVARYGPDTQLSETECFATDEELAMFPDLVGRTTIVLRGRGTEEERRQALLRNIEEMRAARIRPNVHTICGMIAVGPCWLPKREAW